MGNLEALASSGNLLHTALEARSALTDVNLLHALQELGHPYGILAATNACAVHSIYFISASSSVSSEYSDNAGFKDLSLFSSDETKMPISMGVYSFILSNSFMSMSDDRYCPELSDLSINPSSSAKEISSKKIDIGKHSLHLGSVSLNLTQFKGQEPFIVKSPQGEPITEIQPGSPLAFLHLNRQAAEMRQKSPLERIQTMTQDLKEIFRLIDNPTSLEGLKQEQQAVLSAAKSAVIVGISHLVPIFHRITNFPTWKLDVLPKAVQEFHRFDSQAVSNQFGGKRQVKVEDIEMTVITPQMRQQLVEVTL